MHIRVLQCLILLMGLFLCSGTSVRLSYDCRSFYPSSPADFLWLLKQNSTARIQISDRNHGLLSAVCGNRVDLELYVSKNNIEAISKSRALAVAWVQREVSSFINCLNVTIVISSKLMKKNNLPRLLPAIEAIDSALVSLRVDHSIKLSVSLSLSSIEDCFRTQKNPSCQSLRDALVQVMDFLRRTKSFITFDASCGKEVSLDDCLMRVRSCAMSILPDHDIPIQIHLRNTQFSIPIDRVKLRNKTAAQIASKSCIISLSFFIKQPSIKGLKLKEWSCGEEQPFTSRRELTGSKVQSTPSARQRDVITPLATVPVINPATPTSPVLNPFSSPDGTPTTTTTPLTNPFTSPITTSPSSSGQSWCIASQTASQTALQVALDYACGYGGADCSAIQQGGICFNQDTVRDHASYAFNDYYQKNPLPTSCNFGGMAVLTNIDPSTSMCQFPSMSTSSSVLNTTNPAGSAVFGSEPSGSSDAAFTTPSLSLLLILACLVVLLINARHL